MPSRGDSLAKWDMVGGSDGTLFPKIEWALLRLSRYIEGTSELGWPCMLDDARDMIASIRKERGGRPLSLLDLGTILI